MKIISLYLLLVVAIFAQGIQMPEHFQAAFTQTITSPKKRVITYTGEVYFSANSWLKWAYHTPTKKEVCSHNHIIRVVDHDLEQVSEYRMEKGMDLQAILEGATHHHGNVYVAHYNQKQYTLALNAKGFLESMAYYDELDNKVQVLFRKIRAGKGSLSPSLMQCPYPDYYDIIKG
jgi:outer membrane lipoprotein carrier protein